MRRTRLADVAVLFVLAALATYAVLRAAYADLPTVQWFTAVPLLALGAAEFVTAGRVRAAVLHKPDHKPVTAIAIARCVALAKASILGGAGLAGVVAGLLVRVVPQAGRVDAAKHDVATGSVLLVASVVLIACGWRLERATVDPARRRL